LERRSPGVSATRRIAFAAGEALIMEAAEHGNAGEDH